MSAIVALRQLAAATAMRLVGGVLRRPALKFRLRQLLGRMPWLRRRLQAYVQRSAMSPRVRLSSRVQDDADLSPRTVRMLRALRDAERQRQRQP